MGQRGPAPRPTALKVLTGEKPSRINAREPLPTMQTPIAPKWLRPAARRYWRDTVKMLEPMRLLTLADRDQLADYCDARADIEDAQELIAEHGLLITTVDKDGRLRDAVRNPAIMIKNHAWARAYRLAAQFGLMPAARVSLVAGPAPDTTGVEALLS